MKKVIKVWLTAMFIFCFASAAFAELDNETCSGYVAITGYEYITDFQKANGILESNELDQPTCMKVEELANKDENIRIIFENYEDYLEILTESWGYKEVSDFQKENKLKETGIVDLATYAKIQERIYGAPSGKPEVAQTTPASEAVPKKAEKSYFDNIDWAMTGKVMSITFFVLALLVFVYYKRMSKSTNKSKNGAAEMASKSERRRLGVSDAAGDIDSEKADPDQPVEKQNKKNLTFSEKVDIKIEHEGVVEFYRTRMNGSSKARVTALLRKHCQSDCIKTLEEAIRLTQMDLTYVRFGNVMADEWYNQTTKYDGEVKTNGEWVKEHYEEFKGSLIKNVTNEIKDLTEIADPSSTNTTEGKPAEETAIEKKPAGNPEISKKDEAHLKTKKLSGFQHCITVTVSNGKGRTFKCSYEIKDKLYYNPFDPEGKEKFGNIVDLELRIKKTLGIYLNKILTEKMTDENREWIKTLFDKKLVEEIFD